jgi:hypothetical protein
VQVPGTGWTTLSSSFNVQVIPVNTDAVCGLRGTALFCWGQGVTGPTPLGAGTDWSSVSVGGAVCAVSVSGQLTCWLDGTASAPTQETSSTDWRSAQVNPASFDICALRVSGAMVCWLAPRFGQPRRTAAGAWTEITDGLTFTCALRSDATAWCWGDGSLGQMGDGRNVSSDVEWRPRPVQTAARFDWLANGLRLTCGIDRAAGLWCWGTPFFSGLPRSDFPRRVDAAQDWRALALGDLGLCAVKTTGTLWCRGDLLPLANGGWRQVGTDSTWVAVSASAANFCALRAGGSLWCWGANTTGQVGDGTTVNRLTPVRVGAGRTWTSVSVNAGGSTCAVDSSRAVLCWGDNRRGQVGDGTTVTSRLVPTPIDLSLAGAGATWTTVSATCAIRSDRSLWCWGPGRTSVPTRVGTLSDWTGLAGSGFHSCAVRADTSVQCWGFGRNGELGRPPVVFTTVPQPVGGVSAAGGLLADGVVSCALDATGLARCWGLNDLGEVGTGPLPRRVQVL